MLVAPRHNVGRSITTQVASYRLKTKLRRCLLLRTDVGEIADPDPDGASIFRGETALRAARRDLDDLDNHSDGKRDVDEDNNGCEEA